MVRRPRIFPVLAVAVTVVAAATVPAQSEVVVSRKSPLAERRVTHELDRPLAWSVRSNVQRWLRSMLRPAASVKAPSPSDAATIPVAPPRPAASRTFPLYLFLGQSNMIGVSSGIWYLFPNSRDSNGQTVTHLFRQPQFKMWSSDWVGPPSNRRIANWSWEVYQAATLNGIDGNGNPEIDNAPPFGVDLCGLEGAAGDQLTTLHGGDVYAIKIAMISYLTPPQAEYHDDFPCWSKSQGELYDVIMQRVADARAAIAPDTLDVRGVFWSQGESDFTYPGQAEQYADSLRQFIADLRADFAKPNLPFIIGSVHSFYDEGRPPPLFQWQPFINIIRNGQKQVADEDPFVARIITDSYERATMRTPPDPRHFSERGSIDIGRAMVEALRTIGTPVRGDRW